jgi:DNA repair exonuclease SbcCD ATPase subunit
MSTQGEFDFLQPPAHALPLPSLPSLSTGQTPTPAAAASAAPAHDPAMPGMHLQSVRLAQVRQFQQPLHIGGLAPGLNVIAGPNESGKSTVARAIRAAFFERHRSKVVEDLRPLGHSAAMPTVELVFALHGETARLNKAFLAAGAHCDLQWGRQSWSGAEAEDQLAQWLGYQYAGKGVSQPKHWGIPGLLWVEQGEVGELAEAAQFAREPLQQALQAPAVRNPLHQAAVQLAASEGDRLLAQWQAERQLNLTTGGKARGELAEVTAHITQLEAELAQLAQAIASYQQDVDALALVSEQLRADAQQAPWQATQDALDQTQQLQVQLTALTQHQRELTQARQALAQQLSWAQTQLAQAQAQRTELAQRHAQVKAMAAQLAELAQAQTQAQAQVQAAQQASARSQTQAQAWQAAQQHAMRRAHALQLQQEAARLTAAASAAQQAEQAWREAHTQADALALPPQAVQQLHSLHQQCERLQAQLEVAGTSLSWSLSQGAQLQEGEGAEQAMAGQGSRMLTQATRVQLANGDSLHIAPGGMGKVQALQAQLRTAQSQRSAGLQALGLADWAAVQAHAQAAQAAQHTLALAQQQWQALAPQGMAALVSQRDAAQARLAQVQSQLQALDSSGELGQPDQQHHAANANANAASAAPADEAHLAQALQQAQARAQADAHTLAQAERELQAVAHQQLRLQTAHDQALAEGKRLFQASQAPDVQMPDALHTQVQQLQAQLQTADAQLHALGQRLAGTSAQAVSERLAQLNQQLARLKDEHGERQVQQRLLSQKLQQAATHLGNDGLEARRDQVQAQLAQARRRAHELDTRSRALDLLVRLGQQHRQAALARFESPLYARMQAYVPLLWPDAQVHIGAQLGAQGTQTGDQPGGKTSKTTGGGAALLPHSLHRGAHDLLGMPFDKLSMGARDQLALISRMAYADLLQAAGRPTLIMLDDALVHADAQRLAAMQRVLADVATRHQVLVFTCHPEPWQHMPAKQYWLPDAKKQAPTA